MHAQSHGCSATLPENSQLETHGKDGQEEFFRLGCIVLRLVIAIVSPACAANWGRRLEAWSCATVVPTSGYGDLKAVQAVLDLKKEGANQFVSRNKIPFKKPGKERFFSLSDLVGK